MDHGVEGVPRGLERPFDLISSLVRFEIAAILMNPGMLRHTPPELLTSLPPLVVSLDLYINSPRPHGEASGDSHILISSPEEALRLGADMAKLVLVFGQSGHEAYARNVAAIARAIEDCHGLGLPAMVETVVWGHAIEEREWRTVEFVADMVRIGQELGADVLKIPYVGPMSTFAAVVGGCALPIVLLGGPAQSEDAVVSWAREGRQVGVRGFAFGRSIWQNADPGRLVSRLSAI